ncbi:hypothetical protein JHW43_006299 [Diplocarpon mali]|nr:hypothetical protein JHW43_006299 [Diplocarpon mali]
MQCSAVQFSSVQFSSVQSSPVQSSPVHSTLLYSTLLHSSPLHSTLLHSTPLQSRRLDVCSRGWMFRRRGVYAAVRPAGPQIRYTNRGRRAEGRGQRADKQSKQGTADGGTERGDETGLPSSTPSLRPKQKARRPARGTGSRAPAAVGFSGVGGVWNSSLVTRRGVCLECSSRRPAEAGCGALQLPVHLADSCWDGESSSNVPRPIQGMPALFLPIRSARYSLSGQGPGLWQETWIIIGPRSGAQSVWVPGGMAEGWESAETQRSREAVPVAR